LKELKLILFLQRILLFLNFTGQRKDSMSEMQIRDVKNILKTVSDIDMDYIEEWIKKLGLEDIYREANK
jgi:hypothetical protein